VDVESLILLEARPSAGETDEQIVAGAWDFEDINGRYEAHGDVLTRRPRRSLNTAAVATIFHRWLQEEREAWLDVLWRDPLVPECLLPTGYIGKEAWRRRRAVMSEACEQMRAFEPCESARQ